MSIRINKVLKEYDVGISIIEEFLQKKGLPLKEVSINAVLTDEQYNLIKQSKGFSKRPIVLKKKTYYLYGANAYFIGAVKFFDINKDFGFIASNNCNMHTPEYTQDFYVNSASFIEPEAIFEGSVVVFQVERKENGKKKAVNVRRLSKSEEDVRLVLSYYGDHEYILFKDNKKFNLYTHTYKPFKLVVEKVLSIIVNDDQRSPEKTAQHFKFFVEHYKQDPNSPNRYIFDKDFSTEKKSTWVSLFDVFSNDERLAVLKNYPSLCRYFNDENLLQSWIGAYFGEDSSLERLQSIQKVYEYLPSEIVTVAKERIESIADAKISELYRQLSGCSDIDEDDFEPYDSLNQWRWYYNNENLSIINSLNSYLALTTNLHEEEKQNCIVSIRRNKFKQALEVFRDNPFNPRGLEQLSKTYESLGDEKHIHQKELDTSILDVVDKCISDKKYETTINVLERFSSIADVDSETILIRLFPLIKTELREQLLSYIPKPFDLNRYFFNRFYNLTKLFEESQVEEIKAELRPIMLQSESLNCLSVCTMEDGGWLSFEDSIKRVHDIICQWGYDEICHLLKDGKELFGSRCEYNDIVIDKSLSLISSCNLSNSFSGHTGTDLDKQSILRANCSFLKDLKLFVSQASENSKVAWENYVGTRSAEEMLILYEYGIISDLPTNIIAQIVNDITLDSVLADSSRWYHKPILKDKGREQILKNTDVDLFPIISTRLISMDLTQENVPLAVLLAELMTINKPNEDDYFAHRDWEKDFTNKLQKLRRVHWGNNRLVTILWATHFKFSTSQAGLKETFALLPPYLQIRCVKKLFQLISQGKLQLTAESLYELISPTTNSICFPLEIAFAYLKRREKEPSTTLDNNLMLQLLDGRDDHPEWIGIRQLITECDGRWQANQLQDDNSNYKRGSYFNGIIKEEQDKKLIVYVPNKMVDECGNMQNYNNKHFNNIQELIKISYDNSEYQKATTPNGIEYTFDQSHRNDLFSVARAYKLKYNRLDNYVDFEKKEDEEDVFCECRAADALDNLYGISFYWCGNKPCFRQPVRYMLDYEWERYTILDFMRILHIPTDYINQVGKVTKFGHYIILSAYLKSFAKFYEHLKCRECGKLMKPLQITNFASRAVNQFQCSNINCPEHDNTIYLNHCFNKPKCNETIDSRDSKRCPNGQYICPTCGACCSTENFHNRLSHLRETGGVITNSIENFVKNNCGHWEKRIYFCFKCGSQLVEGPHQERWCTKCEELRYQN